MNSIHCQTRATPAAIERLSTALITAFRLDAQAQKSLINHHGGKTLSEAVQQWITETLDNPDHTISNAIMPALATRFHEHIENIRNTYEH